MVPSTLTASSSKLAAGNLLSIPGLGTRGKATAGEINWRIDEILQEYIQQ